MADTALPKTIRAWQFKSTTGGIEKNFFLNADLPLPTVADNEILIQVHSAAINPADYKIPELPFVPKALSPSVTTPGKDFAGTVAKLGANVKGLTVGQLVFGAKAGTSPKGSLAEYMVVNREMLAVVPEGVTADDAAAVGIAGLTAYQSVKPHVKAGDKVFINGGSGGTGMFGIQIAKALGCHVTASCSGANVELCRRLGADEVLDYKSVDIVAELRKKGRVFTVVVDNVGMPRNLYKVSGAFLTPKGHFSQVGGELGLATFANVFTNIARPRFLGGGRNKYQMVMMKSEPQELAQIGAWIQERKIEVVKDSVVEFEDAPKAFERLRTGRAKGKIVIHVKKQ